VTAAEFEQLLAAGWPVERTRNQTVVLAVSGGADSVAMLRACERLRTKLGLELAVGHVHHGLRAAPAERDAEFVQSLCQQLGVPCRVGRVDAASRGDGIEAAAREARYEWLAEFAESLSAAYLATAHTADDQVETILHRIVRGTGIGGLSGIPATRALSPQVTLVRPLLGFTRGQIQEYLSDLQQPACDDETNRDRELTRNRIRHELLPLLEEKYNARAREALLRLGALAGELQILVDSLVADLFQKSCIVTGASRVILKPAALADAQPILVRELLIHLWKHQRWPLQAMTFEHWQRLDAMLRDPAAQAQTLPGSIRAEKQGEQLVLTRPEEC
jgi:tRNA(Ile)-lysidine synthase